MKPSWRYSSFLLDGHRTSPGASVHLINTFEKARVEYKPSFRSGTKCWWGQTPLDRLNVLVGGYTGLCQGLILFYFLFFLFFFLPPTLFSPSPFCLHFIFIIILSSSTLHSFYNIMDYDTPSRGRDFLAFCNRSPDTPLISAADTIL